MAARWTAAVDGQGVQEMAAHLIDNSAGYQEGTSAYGQWRGPYMDGLSPDPWGRRYTANVGMLWRPGGGITVVVSAGSNGIIETPFETIHLLPNGDDIVGMVWARH